MITLDEFKNNVIQIAKPNRFTAEIIFDGSVFTEDPFKNTIPNGMSSFLNELRYLVQDASIPNRSQTNISVKYYGMKLELPGDYDHTDLTLKFINRSDWKPREFFYTWMEMIQSTSRWSNFMGGMNTRFDAEIMFRAFPKIIIQQLGNKEDEVLATYVFFNAFPKDLSEIKLTMTDENIETFDVSFAYSHYERDFGQGVATQQNTTSVTNEPLNTTAYAKFSSGVFDLSGASLYRSLATLL